MKKISMILSLLLLAFMAGAESINVHKTDGTTDTYELTSDVNITFSDVTDNEMMKVLKKDSTIDEFALSDIIIVSFEGGEGIVTDGQTIKEVPISLLKNYPNPFNPSTSISFDLHKTGMVTVAVYNQKGELVKELLHKDLSGGSYKLNWDGKNSKNLSVGSGFYVTKVSVDGQSRTKRMVMVK